MLKLSLNKLQLIAKSRSLKGYKSMSEDELSSFFNASKSVKENEKKLYGYRIN